MKRPAKVDHNAITIEELRKRHAVYFQEMNEHIRDLNKKQGKTVLYIVPAATGRDRAAREDRRGTGAGAEKAIGLVHRRDRPRHAAAESPGRLLQLRGASTAAVQWACPCPAF